MTSHTAPNDLSNFEATPIRDGRRVEVVLRRRGGPPILTQLTPQARQAVETYTAVAEAVLAGGASAPRDNLTGGCSAGAPSRDGRQAMALDQVTFLRKMEAAVAQEEIQVGRRDPLTVPALDLWRRVCLADMTMAHFLARRGLKPAKSRMADLNAGFAAAAERVADAIGATRSPF